MRRDPWEVPTHDECGRPWSEHTTPVNDADIMPPVCPPAATPEPPAQPAPLARIPLTIIVTATGEQTKGVLVAVMAADLDALEAKIASQEELGTSLCAALAEGEAINARLAAALEAAERRIAQTLSLMDDYEEAGDYNPYDAIRAALSGAGEPAGGDVVAPTPGEPYSDNSAEPPPEWQVDEETAARLRAAMPNAEKAAPDG